MKLGNPSNISKNLVFWRVLPWSSSDSFRFPANRSFIISEKMVVIIEPSVGLSLETAINGRAVQGINEQMFPILIGVGLFLTWSLIWFKRPHRLVGIHTRDRACAIFIYAAHRTHAHSNFHPQPKPVDRAHWHSSPSSSPSTLLCNWQLSAVELCNLLLLTAVTN